MKDGVWSALENPRLQAKPKGADEVEMMAVFRLAA